MIWLVSAALAGLPMPYEEAVQRLGSPLTWCDGADSLGVLGDPKALPPLMEAYRKPVEASKLCLLDAMQMLQAETQSHTLYDGGERLLGLHFMTLFPSDAHLPLVVSSLNAAEESERVAAIQALGSQKQTPLWIVSMLPLLDHPDRAVRSEVIDRLMFRREVEVREALRSHVDAEPDPSLKVRLSLVH